MTWYKKNLISPFDFEYFREVAAGAVRTEILRPDMSEQEAIACIWCLHVFVASLANDPDQDWEAFTERLQSPAVILAEFLGDDK